MAREPRPIGTAVNHPDAQSFSPFVQNEYTMTYDAAYLGHNVSDDQLEFLKKAGCDTPGLMGWAQCLIGVTFGLVQNVIVLARDLTSGKASSPIDVILAMICVGSLSAAAILWLTQKSKQKEVDELVKRIRNRNIVSFRHQ